MTPVLKKCLVVVAVAVNLVLSFLSSKKGLAFFLTRDTEKVMDQNSKDALVVWAGTFLGAAGGWWGTSRLAMAYAHPVGTLGTLAGGLIGAVAGAALTKMIVSDPGAMSQMEIDER